MLPNGTRFFYFVLLRVKFLKDSLGGSSWDSVPRHEVCLKTTQLVALISCQYGPLDKKKTLQSPDLDSYMSEFVTPHNRRGKKCKEDQPGVFNPITKNSSLL